MNLLEELVALKEVVHHAIKSHPVSFKELSSKDLRLIWDMKMTDENECLSIFHTKQPQMTESQQQHHGKQSTHYYAICHEIWPQECHTSQRFHNYLLVKRIRLLLVAKIFLQ